MKRILASIARPGALALGGLAAPLLNLAYRLAGQKVRILALPGRHVFFGYYDVNPFSSDSSKLLAISALHGLEAPTPDSKVDIGVFDLADDASRFTRVASSSAWCWQQG